MNIIERLVSDGMLDKLFFADSGKLFWKVRDESIAKYLGITEKGMKIFNSSFAGKEACSETKHSPSYYSCRIAFQGKSYLLYSHRVCFALYHGRVASFIDHLDGNGLNNLETNLREATQKENGRNKRMLKSNTSGISSVYKRKDTGAWVAQCSENGKTVSLGNFNSVEEAILARENWQKDKNFTGRHGK